jgi:hypothetical protein
MKFGGTYLHLLDKKKTTPQLLSLNKEGYMSKVLIKANDDFRHVLKSKRQCMSERFQRCNVISDIQII